MVSGKYDARHTFIGTGTMLVAGQARFNTYILDNGAVIRHCAFLLVGDSVVRRKFAHQKFAGIGSRPEIL
jgi:hypothetical protein